MHNLSESAAIAIATYGVALHLGSDARRQFCVAVVGEAVETGASFDAIATAAKLAADYDSMDEAERALFRKQVQYCRAISGGWKQLGAANQRAFVGGGLPASSAVKLLKAKAEPAKVEETSTVADAETVKLSQKTAQVIGAAEMAVHVAAWLDSADANTVTEAEAKAIMELSNAMTAFRDRTVVQLKLAA